MTRPLSLLDIAAYRGQRALDNAVLGQVTWLIDGSADVDRVRALAARLAVSSQLGRVILPAAILGGHDHWRPLPAAPEVVVEPDPIARAEVLTWVDARGQVPIDPTVRPWHLAIQPFHDGGHAVTLVVSHALTDGVGLINALASTERPASSGYAGPRPGLLAGLRQAVAGIPAGTRAALAAARAPRPAGVSGTPPLMTTQVRPRSVVALVDAADWHGAATARGGSSNALFISVAAQVAVAAGRVTADGTAIVGIPVNVRADGDDVTANALSTVQVRLAPDRLRDLAFIRGEVKRALAESDPPFMAALPIVPYLPRRAVRPLALAALDAGNPVTSASHVGILPPAAVSAPGPASAVIMQLGIQYPQVGQVPERVSAVAAQAPDGVVAVHIGVASDGLADVAGVREALRDALAAFGLTPREAL